MHSRRVFTPVEVFSMYNPASSWGFGGDRVHNPWAAPSQSIFAASGDESEDDCDDDDDDDNTDIDEDDFDDDFDDDFEEEEEDLDE